MSGTRTGDAAQPLPPSRVWFHRVALLACVVAVLVGVPVIAMIPVGVAVVAAMPGPHRWQILGLRRDTGA